MLRIKTPNFLVTAPEVPCHGQGQLETRTRYQDATCLSLPAPCRGPGSSAAVGLGPGAGSIPRHWWEAGKEGRKEGRPCSSSFSPVFRIRAGCVWQPVSVLPLVAEPGSTNRCGQSLGRWWTPLQGSKGSISCLLLLRFPPVPFVFYQKYWNASSQREAGRSGTMHNPP